MRHHAPTTDRPTRPRLTPEERDARNHDALTRAQTGQALTNYPTIFEEFMARGIPADDIHPRENVLTFHAWKAKGRHVRRGEHGVRVLTWIPIADRPDPNADPGTLPRVSKRPKTAVVFHISQTDPDTTATGTGGR